MFCSNCGNKIENNQNFCTRCGSKIPTKPNNNDNTYSPQADNQVVLPKKTKAKKIFFYTSIFIGIALMGYIAFNITFNTFSEVKPKRVDFNIKYDRVDIQEFMDAVCLNADVEYAQVGHVTKGYGDFKNATVAVKLHGQEEEEITVSFYRKDYSDDVQTIYIEYNDYDSENEIICMDTIVKALEISFCGTSKAKEYTDKFSIIGKDLSFEDDTQILAEYSLTSNAKVSIYCNGFSADRWRGTYIIYKN